MTEESGKEQAEALRDALLKGRLSRTDETGTVSFERGKAVISPAGSPWELEIDAGADPGAALRYDSSAGQGRGDYPGELTSQWLNEDVEPEGPSAGRQYAEEQIERYRDENPEWYRP